MSDSNRVGLLYVAESVFGTTPNTPAMKFLRYVNESMQQQSQTVTSQEVRSDRQISDLIRTSYNAGGAINGEFSATTYDDFLQWAMFASGWSSPVTVTATTISAAAADNSFNDSGSGFGSLVVGQWVKVSGFATAANNGIFKITSKTSAKIIVSGGTLVNESVGPSVSVIMGAQVTNGTTLQHFTLERQYLDLSNEFVTYPGCAIEGFSLNTAKEAVLTCAFDLLGKKEVSQTASRSSALGGTETAAPTTDILNAVDDVTAILEGTGAGVQARIDLTQINMSLKNNLRARTQIATDGAVSIGAGSINITGNLSGYYTGKTLIDKFLNRTQTALALVLTKGSKYYVIDIPAVKFSSGSRNSGGINSDVMTEIGFQAILSSSDLVTARIVKW